MNHRSLLLFRTFRDYSQGAYRMRGIGVGQTIRLYIIPEVLKLIKKEVIALITLNTLRVTTLR